MNALIRLATTYPKTVIAVLLLITLPFLHGFFFKTYYNDVGIYFDKDDPAMLFYKEFQKTYGNEEAAFIALHADNVFTNKVLGIIREISDVAKKTHGIERVFSLTEATVPVDSDGMVEFKPVVPEGHLDVATMQGVRKRALRHEMLTETLLAKDCATTIIVVELVPNISPEEKGPILNDIANQATEIAGTDASIYFSGSPFVEFEINHLTQKDDFVFTICTIILVFVLSLIFLRKVSLAALCVLNVLIVVVWSVGLFEKTGNQFNMMTVVMPPVLLAIAVADAIHILTHFMYNVEVLGKPRYEAAVETTKRMWWPCLFTSLTTGVGFLSFLTALIVPVRVLGQYTFYGVLIAFLITMLLLPAIMVVVPEKWLVHLPGHDSRIPKIDMTRMLLAIGRFTIAHYKLVTVLGILILIVAGVGITRMRYETNFANFLKESNRTKQGIRFIEKNFSGTVPVVLLIRANSPDKDFSHPESIKMLEKVQSDIKTKFSEFYTSFFSVSDYLKEINRAFNGDQDSFYTIPESQGDIIDYYELSEADDIRRLITDDYMEARISFYSYLGPMNRAKILQNYMATQVQKMLGTDYTFHATGTTNLYSVMDENLRISQSRSFSSAFAVILLMMFFVCRNVKLTFMSMLPNLFPIICTFGLMGYLDIPLDVSTMLIASVTIGIAVDDTIHFVVWFRRNQDMGMRLEDALLKTYEDTGQPIVVTSIILSTCFFVFTAGSVQPVEDFGMLAGLAMVFAVIGDLFVLPVLILIFKPGEARKKADGVEPASAPLRELSAVQEDEPASLD